MQYFYIVALCAMHAQIHCSLKKWPVKKQTTELPKYQSVTEQIQKVTPRINQKLNTELFEAIEEADAERVRSLLKPQSHWWFIGRKSIPDINAKLQDETPLTLAIENKYANIVKLLLEAGADPNIKKPSPFPEVDTTPLIIAVSNKSNDIVTMLLEADADPNMSDYHGTTALMYAASVGDPELVKLLLNANAKLDLINSFGLSALDYAAMYTPDLIKILLNAGAKPTKKFWEYVRPRSGLMKLVEEYNKEIEHQNKPITQAVAHALPEAGWQDVAKIIGEYAAQPLVQEIEAKEKNTAEEQ